MPLIVTELDRLASSETFEIWMDKIVFFFKINIPIIHAVLTQIFVANANRNCLCDLEIGLEYNVAIQLLSSATNYNQFQIVYGRFLFHLYSFELGIELKLIFI
jgi:hypothetical protein